MVINMDELSMKLVRLTNDYIVPAASVLAITDVLNLPGFRFFIVSFMFMVAVVIFGTEAIDVVRGGLMETTGSRSVQAL